MTTYGSQDCEPVGVPADKCSGGLSVLSWKRSVFMMDVMFLGQVSSLEQSWIVHMICCLSIMLMTGQG